MNKDFEILYSYIVHCGKKDYPDDYFGNGTRVIRYYTYDGFNKLVAARNNRLRRSLYCFVFQKDDNYNGQWGHMTWDMNEADVPEFWKPHLERVRESKFMRVIKTS